MNLREYYPTKETPSPNGFWGKLTQEFKKKYLILHKVLQSLEKCAFCNQFYMESIISKLKKDITRKY